MQIIDLEWAKWILEQKCGISRSDADTVRVVRCKDCRHWGRQVEGNTACCYAWSRHGTVRTQAAQWCSYGELSKEYDNDQSEEQQCGDQL